MFKFVKIEHSYLPDKPTSWRLLIDTIHSLKSFLVYRGNLLGDSYIYLKQRMVRQDKGEFVGHLSDREHVAIEMTLSNSNNNTFVGDIKDLINTFLGPMIEAVLIGKTLLVAKNNAYMFLKDDVKILETKNKDVFVFPEQEEWTEKDIKITKWEVGKHYYARVGDYDVQDKEGNVKWGTEKEAMRQAKLFLAELKNSRK